jgi:prepilin-type N-terminal cleavage/methylation domain-containing protein
MFGIWAASFEDNAVATGNQVNKTELIVTRLLYRSHRAKQKETSSMKNKIARKAGFTLVEIMIVVAIIGLLAAIAIPNFLKARATSQQNACINNLRQIDAAKQQWALETGQAPTVLPTALNITPYLGRGAAGSLTSVVCPLDPNSPKAFATSYTMGTLSVAPACAINGGVGAVDPNHPHNLPN